MLQSSTEAQVRKISYSSDRFYAHSHKFNENLICNCGTTRDEFENQQTGAFDDGYVWYISKNAPVKNTGSVLSEGNLWIVLAVAVLAMGAVVVLILIKKKKAPAGVPVMKDEE